MPENKNKVHTWYDPPSYKGEENSGEVVVEREGYIPAHVEIQELIKAGEALNRQRGEYEFGVDEEVPDGYIDPFRDPDADFVDLDNAVGTLAHNMRQEAEEQRVKAEEEKKAAEDAAAKAKEEEINNRIEQEVAKRTAK